MAPADASGVEPTVDVVASEIRVVVGRVRSPAGLAEPELPVLDALAGGRAGVPDLIADAIARISSEQYREFLTLLLPFPFQPAAPWEQLGPNRRSDGRGERASRAAFGLSWDACNRPGQLLDGRSRRDWAERFLAESILDGATGVASEPTVAGAGPDAPVEASSPEPGGADASSALDSPADAPVAEVAPSVQTSGRATARTRRRGLVVGAAVVVLLVVGSLVVVAIRRGSSTDDEASPTTAAAGAATDVGGESTVAPDRISCAAVGSLNSVASAEPNAQALSQEFIDLYATLPADVGCPKDRAFLWGELAVQELDSGEADLPGALLVERTSGLAVYLTPTAYTRYRTLGSGDGSIAQDLGGLPGEVVTLPDGSQEVQLSKGVLFVAERAGAPFFWVPGDFLELYRRSGWLGRPVGNPLPSLQQDYQHGYGEFDRATSELHLTPVDAPGAELPAIADLSNTVMRQADGTAWWIGSDGKRYWIATGGVWNCLVKGRDEEVRTARAYAIASLPYGGHAECSKG